MAESPKPDLTDASDTDEVYRLAYKLAAWGLRNGECDEYDAVEWVLGHAHETQLPRGSSGRLNPTEHHITKGAEKAVELYVPGLRNEFDPEPLHGLAARVSGSGVTHEKYLLGAIALCHRYQTFTPVITGRLLAEAAGVTKSAADQVISTWSKTKAYGFFTKVTYDGQRGHGRVWTVDPGWVPVSKPKHEPGCNRSASRCRCPGLSQSAVPIFSAVKDRYREVRQFEEWVATLKPRSPLTVTAVAKQLNITRYAATKLLREQQGKLLDEFTYQGGLTWRRDAAGVRRRSRQGETWFVA
ncbi:hypothetical protein NLB33_27035 [Mycolicibacterium smegmatis]|uniref:hypothetical protein n=1 Tax=Mycolicibacterium smegmatis TaxID=1772 RepID=UPI0020A30DDA|nr:hypothetical protein [Mycolicibacterium smegmatis]MCP2626503.1 hypothetical protein [Mycolicibacterium smegmatis]